MKGNGASNYCFSRRHRRIANSGGLPAFSPNEQRDPESSQPIVLSEICPYQTDLCPTEGASAPCHLLSHAYGCICNKSVHIWQMQLHIGQSH